MLPQVHINCNLFSSRRYGFNIDDVLLNNSGYVIDTIRSYVQCMVTDTRKNVPDLLFECVLIRDGLALLPGWFLKSDVQTIISCLYTTL